MASGGSSDVKNVFETYAKFGKTEAQIKEMKGGLRIETRNIQKLMKETGIIDSKYTTQLLDNDISRVIGKLVTSNPTKYPKGSKTLELEGFNALLQQIADSKKQSYEDIVARASATSGPSTAGTTGVANKDNVSRMTDASKYTGSHKERFDESGKGKGAEGRKDVVDNTGYVGNYKGAGTYDKKN